jgi:hypothetical protein
MTSPMFVSNPEVCASQLASLVGFAELPDGVSWLLLAATALVTGAYAFAAYVLYRFARLFSRSARQARDHWVPRG